MDYFRTPTTTRSRRIISNTHLKIPDSPRMPLLGVGTGINVYSLRRSPHAGVCRSPWAIKKVNRRIPDSTIEKRLAEEAEVLKKLNHPNIIGFRAFVKADDGGQCLVMEACESSLTDLIELRQEDRLGPFPAEIILRVAFDIAKGLNYLHNDCHLLHGDIKSFNILVKGDFEIAKICDFGVCLHLDADGILDPTHEGSEVTYVGTPCWTAPEVLDELDQKITNKADIFAYGIVLWEMISLQLPHMPECGNSGDTYSVHSDESPDNCSSIEDSTGSFDEDRFEESLVKRLGTRPELLNISLGKEYAPVIHLFNWCTESDPSLRPHSQQVVDYLDDILTKKSGSLV